MDHKRIPFEELSTRSGEFLVYTKLTIIQPTRGLLLYIVSRAGTQSTNEEWKRNPLHILKPQQTWYDSEFRN